MRQTEDIANIDDLKKKVRRIISIYEVDVAKKKIKDLLNDYQSIDINICVIGARGSGKSSFINKMMGRKVAQTGVKETTIEATPYPYPENERVVFWDLPGYRDKLYPRIEEYVVEMNIRRYDVILFLYNDSFQPDDEEMLRTISALGKPYFLIRTRFDVDCQDGYEHLVKQEILSDLKVKNLPGDGVKLYFISNRSHGFDHNILVQDVFSETDKIHADVFNNTLKRTNKDLLVTKKQALENRIWSAAVVGASIGAMPVLCTGMLINTAMLLRETFFMANVLGVKDFIEESQIFHEYRKYFSEPGLIATLQNNAMTSAKYFACDVISLVPGIGSLVSSVLDYNIAKGTLSKVLEDFLEVAEYKMGLEERAALPADF